MRTTQALLLTLAGRQPDSPQAEAAVRELADQDGADSTALLARLPPRWRDSAPVQAQRLRNGGEAPGGAGGTSRLEEALAVLRRWPEDPASWDLQWDLAREQLLKGRWGQAQTLLSGIDSRELFVSNEDLTPFKNPCR